MPVENRINYLIEIENKKEEIILWDDFDLILKFDDSIIKKVLSLVYEKESSSIQIINLEEEFKFNCF